MLKHITGVVAIGMMLAGPVASAQAAQKPRTQAVRPQKPQAQTAQPQRPRAQAAGPKMQLAQRLRHGVRSGQLTPAELSRIRQRLQALRAEVKQLKSSGSVSKQDRAALRREWRQLSRLVFLARHNRIKRGGGESSR